MLLFQALSFCSLRCLCYSRDTMLPQISAQVMHAKLDDHTLAMLGIAPALIPPRRWFGDAERWTSKKARVSSGASEIRTLSCFERHLDSLLLSFPPTSNHPGQEDILTFQVSLTFHSVGFYYHCTILSGFLAFVVGFQTIPAIITFIALRTLLDSQGHPIGPLLLFIEVSRSRITFRYPFVCSEREEGIVRSSLADYLQPPQSAHLFQSWSTLVDICRMESESQKLLSILTL
jgi:hypothetical protein